MTLETLENEIRGAIPRLFEMARSLTSNKISDNYKLILTEIKHSSENFYEQRKINKLVNDEKIPMALTELMPTLKKLYNNFYDINLHIYKATRSITIIDFRYYPKSSLDQDFRIKVWTTHQCYIARLHSHRGWLTKVKNSISIGNIMKQN